MNTNYIPIELNLDTADYSKQGAFLPTKKIKDVKVDSIKRHAYVGINANDNSDKLNNYKRNFFWSYKWD